MTHEANEIDGQVAVSSDRCAPESAPSLGVILVAPYLLRRDDLGVHRQRSSTATTDAAQAVEGKRSETKPIVFEVNKALCRVCRSDIPLKIRGPWKDEHSASQKSDQNSARATARRNFL